MLSPGISLSECEQLWVKSYKKQPLDSISCTVRGFEISSPTEPIILLRTKQSNQAVVLYR